MPADRPARPAAVLAVDGGNSKADVALVGHEGELLAALRGGTISHQAVGLEPGMDRLATLVERLRTEAGLAANGPVAEIGVYSVAGADFPSDERLLARALGRRRFAAADVVLNDSFGALRAGTDRGWGVVLICGQGVNAAAVAPDGRSARFPAVGDISGDWGGGTSVGMAGLAAAVRARDGRGPRTALERLVPARFGLRRPDAVTRALYDGRIRGGRIGELSPVVFAAAREGDAVARSIVDRLATELATMANALIRRLRLRRLDVEVVLGGGVFRADDPAFFAALESQIRDLAPAARLVHLKAPPVVGAALIGLDRLARSTIPEESAAGLRRAFAAWRPAEPGRD